MGNDLYDEHDEIWKAIPDYEGYYDVSNMGRVLDDVDVVGTDREKYSFGLGLIEASINDIEKLPCRASITPSDFYCGRSERRIDGEIIPE